MLHCGEGILIQGTVIYYTVSALLVFFSPCGGSYLTWTGCAQQCLLLPTVKREAKNNTTNSTEKLCQLCQFAMVLINKNQSALHAYPNERHKLLAWVLIGAVWWNSEQILEQCSSNTGLTLLSQWVAGWMCTRVSRCEGAGHVKAGWVTKAWRHLLVAGCCEEAGSHAMKSWVDAGIAAYNVHQSGAV